MKTIEIISGVSAIAIVALIWAVSFFGAKKAEEIFSDPNIAIPVIYTVATFGSIVTLFTMGNAITLIVAPCCMVTFVTGFFVGRRHVW